MLTNPTAWLMGYSIIIKDGKLHDHNPNKQFVEFKCSKGHKWLLEYFKPCPTCYLTAGVGGQKRAIK